MRSRRRSIDYGIKLVVTSAVAACMLITTAGGIVLAKPDRADPADNHMQIEKQWLNDFLSRAVLPPGQVNDTDRNMIDGESIDQILSLTEYRQRLPLIATYLIKASASGYLYWDARRGNSDEVCVVFDPIARPKTDFSQLARLYSGINLIAEWDPSAPAERLGMITRINSADPWPGCPVIPRSKLLQGDLTVELIAFNDNEEILLCKVPLCLPRESNMYFSEPDPE